MRPDYDKDYSDTFHSPGIDPWITGFLKGKSPNSVIDVGCGFGFTALLLRLYLGYNGYLVGLDISKGKMSKAKELGLYDDLAVGDARKPPFKSGAFGALVSIEVLHSLSSEALTSNEEIVDENGSIILALPRLPKDISVKDLIRREYDIHRCLLRGFVLVDLKNRKVLLARNSAFFKVIKAVLVVLMPLLSVTRRLFKNGYMLAFRESRV